MQDLIQLSRLDLRMDKSAKNNVFARDGKNDATLK
jgi:hypothetical protein